MAGKNMVFLCGLIKPAMILNQRKTSVKGPDHPGAGERFSKQARLNSARKDR
jgi:hypothetical protein